MTKSNKFTMKVMDKKDNIFELHFIPIFKNPSPYYPKYYHVGWKCKVHTNSEYDTYIQEYIYNDTSLNSIISEWIQNDYKYTQPLKKVNSDEE